MSDIVEAAGLLLFAQTEPLQFLLMQHTDRWDLPKGHSEPGEDLLATALRETEEETGIPPHSITVDPDFQFVIEYDVSGKKRGDYRKRVTYFLGYIEQPLAVNVTEHIGFRWLDWPWGEPIQAATIDPLLDHVTRHFEAKRG